MGAQTHRELLVKYLTRLNQHDVQRALEDLAEDFQLEFAGGPTLGKAGLLSALGWDSGTDGRIEWRIVSESAAEIEVEGTETNEFLTLVGIDPLEFHSQFQFNDDGLISRQVHNVDWTDVSVSDSLAPAIEWATEHAAEELERAYPGGRMTYSEETGRHWVALLRRWKADTNP